MTDKITAALAFINRMAQFTTPEDEFAEPERGIAKVHATVEDYVADLDDERLCSEFQTFMDMVREARTIRDAQPAPGWSGSPCPEDPDNYWIDDKTGERIKA